MALRRFVWSCRANAYGGDITPVRSDGDAFRRAIILVHGFNNNVDMAHESYSAFEKAVFARSRGFIADDSFGSVALVEFYWPGDTLLSRFGQFAHGVGAVAYGRQIGVAIGAASELFYKLSRSPMIQEVSFVAHSMGCRLVLELLKLAEQNPRQAFPRLGTAILMAGAVPIEFLGLSKSDGMPPRLQPHLRQVNDACYVLFSPHDKVLRLAFPAGQLSASRSEWSREALGLLGFPVEFASQRKLLFGADHGDYWASPESAEFLAQKFGF
jgi:pimeloyl-ACP methyl ester carboxylesterase